MKWHRDSNYLVLLAAKSERDLYKIIEKAEERGIKYKAFREPDLGNAITAIALEPGNESKRLCSSLPLALKNLPSEEDCKKEADLRRVVREMNACEQTEGMTIYEHGMMVRDRLFQLLDHLDGHPLQGEWRLPTWFNEYREQIKNGLMDRYTLDKYTIFHDCGKPNCRTVDENGKQHFHNHAQVSAWVWDPIGGEPEIGRLIGMDMDIHLLKADGVDEFCQRPEAISLLLAGLAEIHANASMFGGIESTSFKIKWKQIDRRGRAILKQLFNN